MEQDRSVYDDRLPGETAEELGAPFEARPLELEDSAYEAREGRSEFSDEPPDGDFGEADDNDAQGAARDTGAVEDAAPSRRRRRRRGRRGVHREDAFLGIDRLATEDIAGHQPPAAEQRLEDEDETDDRDDISLGEEITAIEIGGDENDAEPSAASESEMQRRRRRRRRGRGRGSKERTAESARADADDDEADDDTETLRHDREPRAGVRDEKRRDETDADDDELDAEEDGERPSKNLHREVTPWAEAIGFIVSANMEARARSPSGGGQRGGRWGKGERR